MTNWSDLILRGRTYDNSMEHDVYVQTVMDVSTAQTIGTSVVLTLGDHICQLTDQRIFVRKENDLPTYVTLNDSLGCRVLIKDAKGDASINNIIILSDKLIDGETSTVINTNYGFVMLEFNGTDWSIVGR